MKVSVVILNWNGKDDTLECLKSLGCLTDLKDELEIIVVDNASSDGSVEAISKKFPHVTILENKENLGFSEGNNVGIRHALRNGADYILLLNNDTVVDQGIVQELIAASKKHNDNAVIGAKIYFFPGREFHKSRYKKEQLGKVFWYAGGLIDWDNVLPTHRGVDEVDTGQYEKMQETDYISGCTLFAPRCVFEKLKGFDKKYFAYYEDVDFSVRSKQTRFKLVYAPKAIVWHKNAGSSGGSGSSTHQYYMIRNQLIFGLQYAPLRAKLALIKQSIVILTKGNKWERWGVVDYFMRRLGKSKRSLLY